MNITISKGHPHPLGATCIAGGINFAVISENEPILCVAPLNNPTAYEEIRLASTGSIWHAQIATEESPLVYGYKTNGNMLIDPYAKLLNSGHTFGQNRWNNASLQPLGVVIQPNHFDWEGVERPQLNLVDLMIYEMHIRAFTQDASSAVVNPGTYLGAIEKIPHLKRLGVTAVELMPIQEFDETEYVRINPKTGEKLYNFWGYSPLSFFAPMQRYAATNDAVNELKLMIKEFHKAGNKVILDMVFNHTGEGNEEGRILSWKGLYEKSYYILDPQGKHSNFSGCGNTLNCNEPLVQDMIIASLQHWCSEYHIDGFRFDLASILARGPTGKPLAEPPLLERITHDPLLKDCILIAEPWDAAGLHQVGSFYKKTWKETSRWIEWNDDFRTVVRRFIKGDYNMSGRFATKLSGSQDIYSHGGSPLNSMNYITAHDGFTLHDLISYNHKHNFANGEDNRDGMDHNDSWNCGAEGETKVQKILSLRKRQMKNYLLALFLAQGIPMLLMGDEYGHTKHGNNNTWCHDNQLNWFLWNEAEKNEWLQEFIQELIHLRKAIPQISRDQFLKKEDVEWHGTIPHHPDWSESNRLIVYTLKDHATYKDVYIAFNASDETAELTLPEPLGGKSWQLALTTDTTNGKHAIHKKVKLHAHAALVLLAQ